MGSSGEIWHDNNFDEDLLVAERRRHIRYFLYSSIQYGLISGDGGMLFDAHTLNLSRSGLCIATNYPLGYGQEITIRGKVPSLHARRAAVRWITEIEGENLFGYANVAGLEFIEYISDFVTLQE